MLTTAWKNVKQQTIANCFAKAGFQHMSDTNTPDDALDNQDLQSRCQLLSCVQPGIGSGLSSCELSLGHRAVSRQLYWVVEN
jgi:hypothetical protein